MNFETLNRPDDYKPSFLIIFFSFQSFFLWKSLSTCWYASQGKAPIKTMSSSSIPADSRRHPIDVLNETLQTLTLPEDRKATAVALARLLQGLEYQSEAPMEMIGTLDLIKSALEQPKLYEQNKRLHMEFIVKLSNSIQAKIKEIDPSLIQSPKKKSSEKPSSDCILC